MTFSIVNALIAQSVTWPSYRFMWGESVKLSTNHFKRMIECQIDGIVKYLQN